MKQDDKVKEIKEIITLSTELKQLKNNEFFIIKGMMIERKLSKKRTV